MSQRDVQRSLVYGAEQLTQRLLARAGDYPTITVAGSTLTLPIERKFASVESVQAYVNKVFALNWVRAQYPQVTSTLLVRERAGNRSAHYEHRTATIAIPTHRIGDGWALRELVVLHEVAHHLTDPAEPSHGPMFAAIYVALVGGIIGDEAGFLLRVNLLECGAQLAP